MVQRWISSSSARAASTPAPVGSHGAWVARYELAEPFGEVERHIRLLTPLAFIPPRTLAAIIDGSGPHDATVSALAQAVPHRWDRNPAGKFSEQSSSGGS
jgi:hypothetical protein